MATINALITTFPGLPNLTLPLPRSTPLSALHDALHALLPPPRTRYLLSTTSGRLLPASSRTTLAALAPGHDFLTLRLTLPVCGGKGGFGSQLRAAGGRMSSRKKRGQQENNDSCRNLDGRRMRTVKEAKALAAYLEIKPEMDRVEREKRRERALRVIAAADRKEAGGGGGGGSGRFEDVKWLEETEEERERMREVVGRSMREGFVDRTFTTGGGGSSSGGGSSGSGSDEEVVKRFAGWDEDDEFLSSSEEEDSEEEEEGEGDEERMEGIQEEEEEEEEVYEGKGKGKSSL